jgi:hypothetical protein
MIEITERPFNDTERKILLDQIPTTGERTENGVMAFIFILFIFLGPLLLIDKYWFDVPPNIELIVILPILAIVTFLTYIFDKKMFDYKYTKSDIESGIVTTYKVKTNRVIKRKDPEDFGPHYYIDLDSEGEYKTLFIWGQYLMEFKRKTFPCTEFELVKTKQGQVIKLIPGGQYLKPERTLKAYAMKDYRAGKVPDDGQLLKVSLDEIVE